MDFPPTFHQWLRNYHDILKLEKQDFRNFILLLQNLDDEMLQLMKDNSEMIPAMLLSEGEAYSQNFIAFIQKHP